MSKLSSIAEGKVQEISTSFCDRHVNTLRQLKMLSEPISNLSLPVTGADTNTVMDAFEALRKAINASFSSLISLGIDADPLRDIPSFSNPTTPVTAREASALRDGLNKLTGAIERLGQAGKQIEIDCDRDTDSDDEEVIRDNLETFVKAVEAIRELYTNVAKSVTSG